MQNILTNIADCIYQEYKSLKFSRTGVYDGVGGVVLFLFYYSLYTNQEKYRKLAEKLSERIFLQPLGKLSTFSSGLSGVLYLFAYLQEHNFIRFDVKECLCEIKSFLNHHLDNYIKYNKYDFMHGALGIGLYFLKVQNSPSSIYKLIDYLYQTSTHDEEQKIFKWQSVLDWQKGNVGYNISLSHGISSIIIFLCKAINKGFRSDKVNQMLKGAVNYVLSQESKDKKSVSLFPSQSLENVTEKGYSRLAWCYGDLGVGISLLYAGVTMQNRNLENKALDILECSTGRISLLQNSVIDAGICHGSAGIAMIYNRLYLVTNKRCFYVAYDYWISKTLEFSQFEDGLAGYKSFYPQGWLKDFSLLTGIAGIGLVLLSKVYKDRQEWDELFIIH